VDRKSTQEAVLVIEGRPPSMEVAEARFRKLGGGRVLDFKGLWEKPLSHAGPSIYTELRPRRTFPIHGSRHHWPPLLPSKLASTLMGPTDIFAATHSQCHACRLMHWTWRSRDGLYSEREHQYGYSESGCQSDFHKLLPVAQTLAQNASLLW